MASRTFFASQAVGLMVGGALGSGNAFNATGYHPSNMANTNIVHARLNGVQSVGLSTSIDFTQIFELGYLQIFENVEGIPTCEVTIERNIPSNGYTMYQLAGLNPGTTEYRERFTNDLLAFGSDEPMAVRLAVNSNANQIGRGGSQAPYCQYIHITGYTSSYSVNATVDGPVSESMTLLGTSVEIVPSGSSNTNLLPSGGDAGANTYRGRDCHFRTAMVSGGPPSYSTKDRVQSFSLSVDIGREDLQELGRKQPYLRYSNFPTEVTCDVEYNLDLSKEVDTDLFPTHSLTSMFNGFTATDNCDLNPASGYVVMLSGARLIDCYPSEQYGPNLICATSGAKLTSESYSGGDTGGGPVTVSKSYQAFNNMISYVEHT